MKAKQIEIACRNLDKVQKELEIEVRSCDLPSWFRIPETKFFYEYMALRKLFILNALSQNEYNLEDMAFKRGQLKVIHEIFEYEENNKNKDDTEQEQEETAVDSESKPGSVGFISLEMSSEQLATRLLSMKTGISSNNIRRGKLSTSKRNDEFSK